jgi:predicted AAA+ superfamily ATPase
MTDLIRHAGKFRSSPVRVRRGNQKFYLVDLALRNAVLRVGDELLTDESMLGLYAENLVFNALCKWRGVLQIDYYREGPREVDFIVHTNPSRYWPIEVKYQHDIRGADLKGIRRFRDKYPCHIPALVTKNRSDFGLRETEPAGEVFWFPLLLFLLLFD